MSLISGLQTDHSDALAKLFALKVIACLDDKAIARQNTSQIPYANVFRLLEMLKYDAFEDESRPGVLDLRDQPERQRVQKAVWYAKIKPALHQALNSVFDLQTISSNEAINELETALKELATTGKVAEREAALSKPISCLSRPCQLRQFLMQFQTAVN